MTASAEGEEAAAPVRVYFPLMADERGWRPAASETLWAAPTSVPNEYRVDNIPFFVPNVSVGDVIRAEPRERGLEFASLVSKAGHRTLGVRYKSEETRSVLRSGLIERGCQVEVGASRRVLAVDVPVEVPLGPVLSYLAAVQERGEVEYYTSDPQQAPAGVPGYPGWPMADPPDFGVFVSRLVWSGDEPLLGVDHDVDGDWMFWGRIEPTDENAEEQLMLVHLGHVLDRFPEVAALASLPPGCSAARLSPDEPFVDAG